MAKNNRVSSKHLQIDKANTAMIVAVAISSFILVFALFSVKGLLSQRNYQSRVIEKKEKARDQLKENISASDGLITSYKSFVGSTQNIIGGNPKGSGDRDGDNAQIILDALPSQYDYPALTTSIEKLVAINGLKIESISGIDDQISQQENISSVSPKPIDVPFEVTVIGSYDRINKVIDIFQKSIRPFTIVNLVLTAKEDKVELNLKAKSYFQPGKSLDNKTEVVK